MNKPLFAGVSTALVTPFLNGEINYPMLQQLIRRQKDAGIQSVVVSGTTGESATLSDPEKINLFRKAKEYANDGLQVIAGTGSNNTKHAIELSCAAQECGVDALLIVTPYYNKTTPEGIIQHYQAIASSVHIPIILYNVPSRTGVDIPVKTYQELSIIPSIAGIKEASGEITKIPRILAACNSNLSIWSGNDEQAVPAVAFGGRGVISVLSNVLPVHTKAMVDAALAGDFDTASALHIKLQPLMEALFSEVNPIPVKAAMKLIGFDCGECRLPLSKISSDALKKLEKALSVL